MLLLLLRPNKLLIPPDLPAPPSLPLADLPRLWERECPPPSDILRPSSETRVEREGEAWEAPAVMWSPTEFQST